MEGTGLADRITALDVTRTFDLTMTYSDQYQVKLGSSEIDEAAANLLKLAEKVDKGIMGNPSFLMVLTGGSIAYRRKDGVLVVPVGCMKQ